MITTIPTFVVIDAIRNSMKWPQSIVILDTSAAPTTTTTTTTTPSKTETKSSLTTSVPTRKTESVKKKTSTSL